ncbi:radical SAM protein [Fluviispira vulneris]|uniref:radical SAM protein n=1 Tax=Fluviispira vulneris TaxID=2763012 RepID=UPI001C951075|nr:radical SAM protein [Fluviispira vulneris]
MVFNLNHIGVQIQKERYRRDRKEWIVGTLKKAFLNDTILDGLLEDYLDNSNPIAGDFGGWGDLIGFLEYVRDANLPYFHKTKFYFYAAAIAAQQIEFDLIKKEEDIPFLYNFVKEFHILSNDNSILLSADGYLNEKFSLTGIVKVKSVQGKISLQNFRKEKNASELIEKLGKKYKWQSESIRMEKNSELDSFWGLSRFEIFSYYSSIDKNISDTNIVSFVERVYPVWLPKSVGITTSLYCNARCSHCYNASHSENKKKFISWNNIRTNIKDWVSLGLNEVGISGGEPFQFPNELVELVGELRKFGVERIVPFSNGFLGEKDQELCEILTKLKNVGFGVNEHDSVKISTGEFHLPYISIDHVLNFAKRHYEIIGRKCIFDIEFLNDNEILKKIIRAAKEKGLEKQIIWNYRSDFSKSGRGKSLLVKEELKEVDLSKMQCPVRYRSAIYPNEGWVYCTGTIFPKKHVSLSKLDDKSIFEIFSTAHFDDKFLFLSLGSFEDYLLHKNKDYKNLDLRMNSKSTACSLCAKIYG